MPSEIAWATISRSKGSLWYSGIVVSKAVCLGSMGRMWKSFYAICVSMNAW